MNLNVLGINHTDRRTLHNGKLDFTNGAGDFNATRASRGAVVDGTAAPHAIRIRKGFKAFLCTLIAVIEDEAMGLNDGGWTNVLAVRPEAGARGGMRTEYSWSTQHKSADFLAIASVRVHLPVRDRC